MGIISLLVGTFIYICIPLGMGLYARKRGLTFWSTFLVSLFFTPIVGFIVFAIEASQKRKSDEQRRERAIRAAKAMPKWACLKCGTLNNGAFCGGCGSPKPSVQPADSRVNDEKEFPTEPKS